MLVSAIAVIVFRLIVPGEPPPLPIYSISWRFIRGFLSYFELFPAFALSALVIPFGIKVHAKEKINPFSPQFLQYLKAPIMSAIVAAILYGLIFFLAIPLIENREADLRFRGRLYRLAVENARDHAAYGRWEEAAQNLAICEVIWPGSPDTARLRTETEIRLETARLTPDFIIPPSLQAPSFITLPEAQPLDATDAIERAEAALAVERFFDAHWLATLAGQLAAPGSAEIAIAARIAGRAWEGVNSLEPSIAQAEAYRIYRLKREGYEALVGREYIKAYYIFLELSEISYRDPDIARFLPISEAGVRQIAFFIDEMQLTMGRMLSGAVYSLPHGLGRIVLRVSSLSIFPDFAEGIGADLMAFDSNGYPLWSIEAPFVRFLPITVDSRPGVTALFRALSKTDENIVWNPVVRNIDQIAPDPSSMVLNVSWDNFLLLSDINRGVSVLSPREIRRAALEFGPYGYMPEVFEAELLKRFSQPLFLFPFGIFTIALGWRYRAEKNPRYMAVPMMGILPLVFYGGIIFKRSFFSNLGTWTVVTFGFTPAVIFFSIGLLVLLILSLIILAAQHG
ncbi:MAG: hypothetical protein FWG77_10225 [Treponema sp.]|nr:hypothetical protein [Treponema sp.]